METVKKDCRTCYWNEHYNKNIFDLPSQCCICSDESVPGNPYPKWALNVSDPCFDSIISNETKQAIKELEQHTSGGVKFDGEKPRMDLLDRYAMEQLAAVLTFGAKKYTSHNWRKGLQYSRLVAASMRHIQAFNDGEDNDPESGMSHVAHAMCCLMFLLGTIKHRPDMDDRWPTTL